MNNVATPLISNTLRAACLERIKEAQSGSGGIEFLLLATSDGYSICHTIPASQDIQPSRLAAMAASFSGISDGLAANANKQSANGSIIETGHGLLVCRQIKSSRHELVLLAAYDKSTNHGLALWSLNNAAKQIANVLEHYN
ncbi:roadblock/LC7 domain-containing protein [Oceanobacter mangrovi]|uniref:roadblock/LC7 domain-containing protein n=1 Tax=Oceanobacter mangrovi TaxID=2862510 RepID=UPI001C8E9FD7|nr:hypothetical protein [Oceanobacter mangrovi]